MTEKFIDITGRIAVVVGGTSGLGRAIALGLAQAGANVVPAGRRAELVASVCEEVEKLGRETVRCAVDVTERESIDELREAVIKRFGRVDILVNAAGRTARTPTAEVGEEEWEAIMDTNLTGMLRACQSFYEPLKRSGRGRIINVASLSSFVAFHEVAAYGASKAGVLALTKSLGAEWARDRISVNAIAPGVFRTALNEKLLDETERGRELLMRTPMRRFGRPEELIGASLFLASDAVSFITGQTITVDGGFLASGVNS
ncbi:MAG: glucose 1-dehydrogenase [Acidobacteria bacterium]|nr:glucose 1-dehydrogenase [Acidobacteriota bacterium]MDQ3756095.1 glucose 1-dehydrogenase [Acidobacteriota bacterium]